MSIVAQCNTTPVRFKVIALLTSVNLNLGVPVHGEVCPQNWIFHRIILFNTSHYVDGAGIRFLVHIHQGDIYYVLSRFGRTPGFAACNENEVALTGQLEGQADLCNVGNRFTNHQSTLRGEIPGEQVELGFVGLYGGRSCAFYTIETQILPHGSNCSTTNTGTCTQDLYQ